MDFIPLSIQDIYLIKPNIHGDKRGYFFESFRQDRLEKAIGYEVNFCQDNESKSKKGVLRGLHFQLPPFSQAKLVKVIDGSVLDVAVDIRKSSPTFGQHVTAELSSENNHQLFIPHGFAHGFLVLSNRATFAYKVDNYYSADHDRGIIFDDQELAIDWNLSSKQILLSDKDKSHPTLSNSLELFK